MQSHKHLYCALFNMQKEHYSNHDCASSMREFAVKYVMTCSFPPIASGNRLQDWESCYHGINS